MEYRGDTVHEKKNYIFTLSMEISVDPARYTHNAKYPDQLEMFLSIRFLVFVLIKWNIEEILS